MNAERWIFLMQLALTILFGLYVDYREYSASLNVNDYNDIALKQPDLPTVTNTGNIKNIENFAFIFKDTSDNNNNKSSSNESRNTARSTAFIFKNTSDYNNNGTSTKGSRSTGEWEPLQSRTLMLPTFKPSLTMMPSINRPLLFSCYAALPNRHHIWLNNVDIINGKLRTEDVYVNQTNYIM